MRTVVIAGACLLCTAAFSQIPSDLEIRKILAERVGADNSGSGLVVGVIDAKGRRVVAYGNLAKDDTRRLDGDTVFEIGSITKVFTSLLLMDMAQRGEIELTDPISKYLPDRVQVPERNNRKITLADLSTQSSGLPRLPANFTPKDPFNPYADYSVQQMYDFLSGYHLTRDIGSQYEYSNFGVGLLGHVLSLRAGKSYEGLVRSRICVPLGMSSTGITLTPEMTARLAVGHSATLDPAKNWDLPTLAGAGALRSSANDLLIFLAANLGYVKTPLAPAMADEVSIRRRAGPDMEIAYAWHVQTRGGNTIIWHNGGTGGYRSYMGFDPKARAGVVVLSNVATAAGPDDIGRHLLDASYPLLKPDTPTVRKEITLDPKVFDRYVGTYQFGPYAVLTVSRDGDRSYIEINQSKLEVFPASDRKFFLKVTDAQFTFAVDPQGAVTHLTLHQNGSDRVLKRLNEAEAKRAMNAIDAHKADMARRVKAQTQSPGTEGAVRRSIRDLQLGEPKYERMGEDLAAATRQQLPQLKAIMTRFGALQSVSFKAVTSGGDDLYEVKFEHGAAEIGVMLGADGKVVTFNFRPL